MIKIHNFQCDLNNILLIYISDTTKTPVYSASRIEEYSNIVVSFLEFLHFIKIVALHAVGHDADIIHS